MPIFLQTKLLQPSFRSERLKSTLQEFYGHYHDLVDRYFVSVSRYASDIFTLSYIFVTPVKASFLLYNLLYPIPDFYTCVLYIDVLVILSPLIARLLTVYFRPLFFLCLSLTECEFLWIMIYE